MTAPERPTSGKIGIFRRVAVERYSQPLDSDIPEMLTPHRPGICLLAVALALLALGLLWYGRDGAATNATPIVSRSDSDCPPTRCTAPVDAP